MSCPAGSISALLGDAEELADEHEVLELIGADAVLRQVDRATVDGAEPSSGQEVERRQVKLAAEATAGLAHGATGLPGIRNRSFRSLRSLHSTAQLHNCTSAHTPPYRGVCVCAGVVRLLCALVQPIVQV